MISLTDMESKVDAVLGWLSNMPTYLITAMIGAIALGIIITFIKRSII